jgi:glycosyltransferase involved in cell wall biosynthesis
MKIPILIPAYNPDEALWNVVDGLIRLDVGDIIIVDDGSKPECMPIFQRLAAMAQCHVVRHAVNSGKGRALKTGLNYFYLNFPNSPGVVTADADGQHQPEDILKIAKTLTEKPGELILGIRKMGKEVPLRSLVGNVLTRLVFSLVIGRKISDTQSGLRGLPRSLVPQLLKVQGERYEYEINMLILTRLQSVAVFEIPIETIYLEKNISSHFNPFFDSMKIYFQLLRYGFSSLLTSFFDFIVFTIAFKLTTDILVSILISRYVVGSVFNYIINRSLVFHSKTQVAASLLKYYFALLIMSVISYFLIGMAMQHLGVRVIPAKVLVETLLFGLTFLIQRDFVFGRYAEDS